MDTVTSLHDYIRDELQIDERSLRSDTPLWGGVIDSVALIRLISFIEEEFGVLIEDDELTPSYFGTIEDIAALVDRKASEPSRETDVGSEAGP
jgi:acyl carrier protein